VIQVDGWTAAAVRREALDETGMDSLKRWLQFGGAPRIPAV